MNEIINIHLGRQPFTVSIEAHKALRAYLAAIKHEVGDKSDDVLKEVETRMAELLTERGIKGEKVVLLEDVDYLKTQLGAPKDFKEDDDARHTDETSGQAKSDQGPKRLYRDTDRGMIAGVSAGLAAYLGIDAIFVRALFIILTVAGGWGILAYIILWLLVPEAKTTSDILLMQGKAVTVGALKKVVERADVPGAAHRAKTVAGSIIERCMKLILWVVGMAFTIAGSISLLAIVSTSIYVAIRGRAVFQEEIFPVGGTEILFTAMSLLASAIACLFLLLIGIAMVRRKWQLPGWAVASLVGILFVSIAVGSAMLPDIIPKVRDRYRAARHSSIRQVEAFDQLSLVGNDDSKFYYIPDSTYFVELRYLGDIKTDVIRTEVINGKLSIDSRELGKQAQCKAICLVSDRVVEVTVHAPAIRLVTVEGGSAFFGVKTSLTQQDLAIETSRTASLRLSHMHPTAVSVFNDSTALRMRIVLTGIRAGAMDGDTLQVYGDSVMITRADEVQLRTDQTCQPWEPFVSMATPPKKLFINGEEQQTTRVTTKPDLYNCAFIEGVSRPDQATPYYHR